MNDLLNSVYKILENIFFFLVVLVIAITYLFP
jgi:hypothetical protein